MWAYRFPIPCPILAFADLEKPAPPTILAWENRCFPPKFDSGGENSAMAENLERLKQRIPLLEYLQRHNWKPCRAGARQEFVGLCPLHQETHPSFYVNASKNLFYCHGCGQGGDLIRFVQLFLDLPFRQTVAHLEQELPPAPVFRLLEETAAFYQLQLHRHPEATDYLERRGVRDSSLIEELGIGYAPGGCLRRHLAPWCCSLDRLLEIGLINHHGRDAFCRRVIFPCWQHGQVVNLYGSIGAAFPHRLLPALEGRFIRLAVRQQFLHRDSGGRTVRFGRTVASWFPEHHLRDRHPVDTRSVSAACRSTGPFCLHRLRP